MIGLVAARMRAAGARVGVGEVVTAHRAAAVVPAADMRTAVRAALCSSRADLAAFDAAWLKVPPAAEDWRPMFEALTQALPRVALPGPQGHAAVTPVPAAWSSHELLRKKDFAAYSDDERLAARTLLVRLARRAPARASRRTRATRRREETHDLRATARASLRTGGEPFEWRFRRRRTRPRPVVLMLDVSGSMEPYARVLLQYVQAAVAARRRVEAFAFGTRLTRLTREMGGRDPDLALARAMAAVVDMGGGTRIGDSLATLNRLHGARVGRGADVVVLSDGWDRGDPERLTVEMARLRRCAHRVVWLNPLAADPRFEPLTRGMAAALPHTDHLIPGNSITSLEALADLLDAT